MHVVKRIPLGGGLGGGSTDAAAVLRWAGRAEAPLALRLGADVPFSLAGGRALVEGVGERVTPLAFEPRVVPAAGALRSGWTPAGSTRPGTTSLSTDGPNALTAAALVVEPRLARWRDALEDLAGRQPTLAGSGSTWFVDAGGTLRGGRGAALVGAGSGVRPAGARPHGAGRAGPGTEVPRYYLPARRCQRVALSIFLCFFLRMRLRRFLISDPMSCGRLAVPSVDCQVGPGEIGRRRSVSFEIIGLDHVQLAMPAGREDEAEAFYAGLPRLHPPPKPEPMASRGGCWFASGPGAASTWAWKRTSRPPGKGAPGIDRLRDLPALVAALAQAGVTVRPESGSAREGAGCYVDDPFGNRIELIAGR